MGKYSAKNSYSYLEPMPEQHIIIKLNFPHIKWNKGITERMEIFMFNKIILLCVLSSDIEIIKIIIIIKDT